MRCTANGVVTATLTHPHRMDTAARIAYRTQIGHRLAAARKARGVMQVDLADAIGVSERVVSNWERGVSVPGADYLGQIADNLCCSVEWLVGSPSGEERICLIDGQSESILLASRAVDDGFRFRQARLATVAHIATLRVPTIEELAGRLADVMHLRSKLEQQHGGGDGSRRSRGGDSPPN